MSLTNAVNCKMAHDECVRTANYKHAGQNVYQKCYHPMSWFPIPSDIGNQGVQSWINEFHNVSDISIEHFVDNDIIAKYGRYLQVVKNNADRVGCSIVRYHNSEDFICDLLVCNYNVGNLIDYPTYEIGPTGSKCSTGFNPTFPGLCSVNEDFTQHKYADVFFENVSPVATEWIKHRKRINTGGVIINYGEEQYESA